MNELGNGPWDKNYKPSGISKAEEAALKAYPEDISYSTVLERPFDYNGNWRRIFTQGYEAAEKDLALTWKDMKVITDIADKMMEEIVPHHSPEWLETEEKYYTEVLKRFKEQRND